VAYFAQLDDSNMVTQVIVVGDGDCGGGGFPDSEAVGQAFIASLGLSGVWLQTSSSFRGKYAGIGDTYDAVNDVFVAPTIDETE
jgi:hypothetical protein